MTRTRGNSKASCETSARLRVFLSIRSVRPVASTYVEAAGPRFLQRFLDGGVKVIGCFGFIAEMLNIEEC